MRGLLAHEQRRIAMLIRSILRRRKPSWTRQKWVHWKRLGHPIVDAVEKELREMLKGQDQCQVSRSR